MTYVITELCHFFRNICSKAIDKSELLKLQKQIDLTLCHLEMLFPPSFFTVMMHLTVHLTEEIELDGLSNFVGCIQLRGTYFETYFASCH